jgi:hypothetical protein
MGAIGLVKEKRWYMGNLPCPMPTDYRHKHSHLMYAIRMGKTVEWIESETAKLRKWAESKGVLRLSWHGTLTWWLRKAVEFETEQAAGRRAYVGLGGPVLGADSSGVLRGAVGVRGNDVAASPVGVAGLTAKIATYHKFLEANERMAAEYLERQPERVRRAILEHGLD